MGEPALDLSEIVDLYKEDARSMIGKMKAALSRWDEVVQGGTARQDLRRLSHQLRGSGRTYGFRAVTHVGKAIEAIIMKIDKNTIAADARARETLQAKIEQLSAIFKV